MSLILLLEPEERWTPYYTQNVWENRLEGSKWISSNNKKAKKHHVETLEGAFPKHEVPTPKDKDAIHF